MDSVNTGGSREAADAAKRKKPQGRAELLSSLDDAFQRYGTPIANRALIQRIYESTDASGLVGFRDHFRIERRGGGPALEVHAGYTNGFRSEQDVARRAGDDVPRWPSKRFHGAWGVDHPQNRPAPASTPTRTRHTSAAAKREPEKPAAVCMTCFLELPATGVCPTCDA